MVGVGKSRTPENRTMMLLQSQTNSALELKGKQSKHETKEGFKRMKLFVKQIT
jgi:hypothetical protein